MSQEKIDRIDLQFEHFQKALARLQEALAEPESSFLRDSIIKRFDVSFEMAWKTMFRYLTNKGERMAPKAWDVIPVAFESLLIADAGLWDKMRNFRNDTSHEYNELRAIELAAYIRSHAEPAFKAFQSEMLKRL